MNDTRRDEIIGVTTGEMKGYCQRPLGALEDLWALKTAFSSFPRAMRSTQPLGAIDEKIYILRKRSVPAPAKAFVLI